MEQTSVNPMKIDTANFDVFRNDVLDVPEQACTNEIECSVETILEAIGEDSGREGLQRAPQIPLERTGTAREIAEALLFLLRSDFVTGELLYVTGGEHLLAGRQT